MDLLRLRHAVTFLLSATDFDDDHFQKLAQALTNSVTASEEVEVGRVRFLMQTWAAADTAERTQLFRLLSHLPATLLDRVVDHDTLLSYTLRWPEASVHADLARIVERMSATALQHDHARVTLLLALHASRFCTATDSAHPIQTYQSRVPDVLRTCLGRVPIEAALQSTLQYQQRLRKRKRDVDGVASSPYLAEIARIDWNLGNVS
jgi:hypothetical protein